jgi:PTH1 family peptidyl-tRNA hydrolase
MLVFAGLGNPGAKYAGNRHNIGFMVLDRIASDHGFGPWKARFQGVASEGQLGGQKVLLLKPMTFMNLSGQSVGEAMRFFKLGSTDITVFHDEIDLAPCKLRVKDGGGHAGHNGLRSIHQHIGPQYSRVRMGVGHPGRKEAVPGYVLNDFAKADQNWLDDVLRGCSDGAPLLAAGHSGKFQNAVALRTAPPRSSGGTAPTGGKPAEPAKARAKTAAKSAAEPVARPEPQPQQEPAPEPKDTRSALQKLADRFR